MPNVKFGTDGWRAVIGDDFTYANLDIVARATAKWLVQTRGGKPEAPGQPSAVLGYDTRFQGRAFAEFVARVLASEGVRVVLSSAHTTTPAISWAAEAYGVDAGLVVTASHNPPSYSGFKIKAYYGGPASPEMIDEVEALYADAPGAAPRAYAEYVAEGLIEEKDVTTDFLHVLHDRLDLPAIRAAGLVIAHDAMFGAGQNLIAELVGPERVIDLHNDLNPGMHGQAPEPIEKNLTGLAETVRAETCALGIANDGDADRVGLFDEKGDFVDSHRTMALLIKYLHEERGFSGSIVKTFSTTHLLDKMGAKYGLPVETTKIGFKYIAPKIVEGDVLVGGEESGGMAVKGHIPERDGLYIGLLVAEMIAKRGKTLSQLVDEVFDEFGAHHDLRLDVHTTHEKKDAILKRLADGGLSEIGGHRVTKVETLDGYKHLLEGEAGAWLLVRPSGTEPVLRIYAEANSREAAQALLDDTAKQLGVSGH